MDWLRKREKPRGSNDAQWIIGGPCTWLITEYDPHERIAFGWCDLGFGFPELGYVSLDEVQALRIPPIGARIERDLSFTPRPLRDAITEEVR